MRTALCNFVILPHELDTQRELWFYFIIRPRNVHYADLRKLCIFSLHLLHLFSLSMAQVCKYDDLIRRWSVWLSFGLLRNNTLIHKILGDITALLRSAFRKQRWNRNGCKETEQILLVWRALYKTWHSNLINYSFWKYLLELVFMLLILVMSLSFHPHYVQCLA